MDPLTDAVELLHQQPDLENQEPVSSVGSQPVAFGGAPRPLPSIRPSAPGLKASLLPEKFRPWIEDISDRMQVPLEMVAVPAMVALAGVVGRRVAIQPKAVDDWTVIPNLWGGIVARPGKLKSPVLAEALRPVRELAAAARADYEDHLHSFQAQLDVLDAQEQAVKGLLKKGYTKPSDDFDAEQLEDDLRAINEQRAELSVDQSRYIVNDSTVEKLGALLATNTNGLTLERDELAGWLRSLEREDRRGDREFFLESWNGTNPYTVDRIGRGTLHIPALCLSIIGGIQPGKLEKYVADAVSGGYAADGLLQRIQLLVWPEDDSDWRLVDRGPDLAAREAACEVFRRIDAMPQPDSVNGTAILRFDQSAQSLFIKWWTELETRIRGSDDLVDCPAYESHLSKYRSLMPALALLLHLADGAEVGSRVSLSAAQMAAAWCDYLDAHARKVYAVELQRGLASAHALAAKIRSGLVQSGMPIRDIYRRCWARLGDADAVDEAIQKLSEHGWAWVRQRRHHDSGPAVQEILVNPQVVQQ